jgi:hypothetical protein
MTRPILALAVALSTALPAATLRFDAPDGWVSHPASSSMRVAEFALPRVAGDAEDASLVVYFFGGQGGSVQANLDRWVGQMSQPDGRSSASVATTSTLSPHGLKVTLVDVTGTYVAETSPGSSDHFDKPGFRLEAAVVETSGGPYFIKLVGPAATVGRWNDAFRTFLASLRFE